MNKENIYQLITLIVMIVLFFSLQIQINKIKKDTIKYGNEVLSLNCNSYTLKNLNKPYCETNISIENLTINIKTDTDSMSWLK